MIDPPPEQVEGPAEAQPRPDDEAPPAIWAPPWILALAALIALLGVVWRCA